jgi:hypothetical protein
MTSDPINRGLSWLSLSRITTSGKTSTNASVRHYLAMIAKGEKLPPIVVTQDHVLVSGDAIVTAARVAGHGKISAIILDATGDDPRVDEMREDLARKGE